MERPPVARVDRRRAARRTPALEDVLSRVRLRTGWDMAVVDISDTGALLEGIARLLPGTHVNAHIITRDGRELVRSRVVRAFVCDVQRDAVRYRAALAFDRPLDTSAHGYSVPATIRDGTASLGTRYPASEAGEQPLATKGL